MSDHDSQYPRYFKQMADSEYEEAIRRGFWRSLISWLTQKQNKLLPFDEIRQMLPFHGQYYAGLQTIPMDKIVGSVARYNDFDSAFIPTQRHTKSRWVSIDIANLASVNLPPIEVYKIGELYFVKDGNHRVSVAREKGQAFIDAHVTEIMTSLPITNMENIFEVIRDQERIEFYEKTQLNILRPDAKIDLTLPGQYEKLLEHIRVHRWFMGEQRGSDVPWEEAVADWYDQVYSPLANVVQEQKILKNFPGRTVADLYLWIMEHLWYLREEFQSEVTLEQAASHFKHEFAQKSTNPIVSLLQKLPAFLADSPPKERETSSKNALSEDSQREQEDAGSQPEKD